METTEKNPAEPHGVKLIPQPSDNPADPLRWSRRLKLMAIITSSFFNFSANFLCAAFTVAVPLWTVEFKRSSNAINGLVSFNFLLLGVGNMFWVPLATKIGKRAALFAAMVLCCVSSIWTARATSYGSLLAARCFAGFGAAAGESIVPGVVGDIFYIHEHASMMSIYIVFITTGSAVGPLIGGFVCALAGDTWRTLGWVCVGLTGFTALCIFLFFPETSFHRDSNLRRDTARLAQTPPEKQAAPSHEHVEFTPSEATGNGRDENQDYVVYMPWRKIWFSPLRRNDHVSWVAAYVRPWIVLAYLPVLWVTILYGTLLAPQVALTIAFPTLLIPPPYLWPASNVGLMQIAAIIGFLIACFGGGYVSDWIFIRRVVQEKGRVYPEQRLLSLLPGFIIGPAGCVLVACACDEKLHWSAIAVGFGMVSAGTVFSPNVAITYLIDCFPELATETLVVVSVLKNVVAFILIYVAHEWISSSGYLEVFMIMFMLTMIPVLLAIPLYFFGIRIRKLCKRIYYPEKEV